MNRLIADLLDATAINAGRLALEPAVCSVAELIEDAVDPFRSQAEVHSLELRDEVDDRSMTIRCDRDRMLQVLSNLISNAVKFTPEAGRVTVSAKREDSSARFAVVDTGHGIAEEHIPHLFERFWRAEAGPEGAGLGLFIARGILAAHGATIQVETALGKGSRFHFSLPLVEPA
jgi:signal transduction histidine kinase